jgi:hypothetical protein
MAWRSPKDQTKSMELTPGDHGEARLFNAGLDNYLIYLSTENPKARANQASMSIRATS